MDETDSKFSDVQQLWKAVGYVPPDTNDGTAIVVRLNCLRFRFSDARLERVDSFVIGRVGGLVRNPKQLDVCHTNHVVSG